MVGLNGLEPSTSRLSGVRSNQLSYKPICSLFTKQYKCYYIFLVLASIFRKFFFCP